MKERKLITGATVLTSVMILVLVVVPAAWIIAGVREGAIIPEFFREDWLNGLFTISFLLIALGHVMQLKEGKNNKK